MRVDLDVQAANARVVELMATSEPVLVDVLPAIECVPGMSPTTILTSGAPLEWSQYTGGQRAAIIGAARSEGLASDAEEAEKKLDAGDVQIAACHDHSCVGSITGVYTASTPVFVVRDGQTGAEAFCSIYEGAVRRRLTYGVYDEAVQANLDHLSSVIGPALSRALRAHGGVDVSVVIRKALQMGDELHSRNTAATALLIRELMGPVVELAQEDPAAATALAGYLKANDLLFLHVAMAAAKLATDGAHGVAGSSVVTAMTTSHSEFAIRVSGLGDRWFRAPVPGIDGRLFEGFTQADVGHMGGESLIVETIGLGGLSAAAAFALQRYSGGTAQAQIEQSSRMYQICVAEHPRYLIPYFDFRGAPLGIDALAVARLGIPPAIDGGIAHREGGHIGAGVMHAPLECFEEAARAFAETFPVAVVESDLEGATDL